MIDTSIWQTQPKRRVFDSMRAWKGLGSFKMPTLTRTGPAFADAVVAITGAASGIGRALAVELSSYGARLALADLDAAGLEETRKRCSKGRPALTTVVDVRDSTAMAAFASETDERWGRVNVIINNAGILFTGDVQWSTLDEAHAVMDTNYWGVVHGTKAFLPYLIKSGAGHIVNVSSAFGLLSAPSYSAYSAAKFAVRGFTEALRQEMVNAGHPVGVSCVYPGGVRTGIMRNSTAAAAADLAAVQRLFDKHVARTEPAAAAVAILRGVRAGRPTILIGPDARVANLLVRLLGWRYQELSRLHSSYMARKAARFSGSAASDG